VHVVVVDPGVGTDRKALAVRFAERTIIGPDNGCLTAFLDGAEAIHEITSTELFLPDVSATFHGRDIFAPVAAFLAGGGELSAVGPELREEPVRAADLWASGETGVVLHVDHFGNLITNFPAAVLEDDLLVSGPGTMLEKKVRTFAEGAGPGGDPFLYAGSGGRLEIAVNGGRAVEVLDWPRGTELKLERAK
jgi:S-adenosylmethionine hydrolase